MIRSYLDEVKFMTIFDQSIESIQLTNVTKDNNKQWIIYVIHKKNKSD